MKLLHSLATKTNEIPLGTAKFASVHEKLADGTVRHVGWQLSAGYAGDNVKNAKHAYALRIESIAELDAVLESILAVRERLRQEGLPEHSLVTDVTRIDTEDD
jgi:hypothetical protein